jgi:ribosomal protein S18 acetylase RimI-like enzyme
MTFTARRLGPDDHGLLRTIRLRALSLEPSAFGSTFDREEAFSEEVWRDRLRPEGNPHFVCCEESGEAVGLVAGMINGDDHEIAELVGMWVDPHARGTGTADALVAEVANWAISKGCTTVRLHVTEGNSRAESTYRRNGFERTGRTFTRERDGFPEIEMERQLEGRAAGSASTATPAGDP